MSRRLLMFCFFFSSRRRHTRFDCDWSSDVCSSDLDQLCLGWPEPKQIAEKLARFTTKDPIELARYTLTLHAGELPAEIGDARVQLDSFVEAVLAELPPEPIHWVNHPIWAYHYPAFHQAREAFLARRAQTKASGEPGDLSERSGAESESLPAASLPAIASTGRGLKQHARQLYYRHFGRAPWLRPL